MKPIYFNLPTFKVCGKLGPGCCWVRVGRFGVSVARESALFSERYGYATVFRFGSLKVWRIKFVTR